MRVPARVTPCILLISADAASPHSTGFEVFKPRDCTRHESARTGRAGGEPTDQV